MITSFREIVLFTPLSSNVIPCRNFQLHGDRVCNSQPAHLKKRVKAERES